ncbi:hypothetical protein [Endozoicomonas sp. ONNA2]|uniref:hypothetical protein n=1 Tax=Endozoicomonas sp. ONNA2 TaxID=2828741 RepID=UPI002149884E|nr:hypothetical protein [Endozoicomonas sp. ONNA2]
MESINSSFGTISIPTDNQEVGDKKPASAGIKSICPNEPSVQIAGAHCNDEPHTALPERTITNPASKTETNLGSAQKTHIESAGATADQNTASSFTQSEFPENLTLDEGNDHASMLSYLNLSMLKELKELLHPPGINMTEPQEPKVKQPSEKVSSSACPPPTPTLIHTHDKVSLIHHAGIQAKNNNCSLASFFMAISNNGLMEWLTDEIKDGVINQQLAGKKEEAASLQELLAICENFHFNEKTNGYIADEGLNRMRTLYRLGHGESCTTLDMPEILTAILTNIYAYREIKKDPSGNVLNLKESKQCLKHKIAWIDAANGFFVTNDSSKVISNLAEGIPLPGTSEGLIEKELKADPPSDSAKYIYAHSQFVGKDGGLLIKCKTKRDIKTNCDLTKTFEYVDDMTHKSRTTEVELAKHPVSGTFVRSSHSSFINVRGQKWLVNHKLSGFKDDSDNSGKWTTTISKEATTVEELIITWLKGIKNDLQLDKSAFEQLLPDEKTGQYPEILLVTIPNFGFTVRPDIQWWKDVAIPTTEDEQVGEQEQLNEQEDKKKLIYEFDSAVSIEEGHFLVWFKDGKVLNYADSMGHSELEETIPVIVKMPFEGTQAALQAADENSGNYYDPYRTATQRLAKLGKSAALIILKKKPTE